MSDIDARVNGVLMIVTFGNASRYTKLPKLWSQCECALTTQRTGLSVFCLMSPIIRRVSDGIMPVSTTSTPSSPMIAIELPLTIADFGSGATKAQMPSATFTVSYDDV